MLDESLPVNGNESVFEEETVPVVFASVDDGVVVGVVPSVMTDET
jgi:hypothetical protein